MVSGDALAELPAVAAFLDGLPDGLRRELIATVQTRRYVAGERLIARDEPVSHIVIILRGEVKVWRELENGAVMALNVLGEGELLGAVAMQYTGTYPATASALTPVLAAAWPIATVRRLLDAYPELATKLIAIINRWVRQMIERMDEVAGVPVEQRLARGLLRLAGELDHGRPTSGAELPLLRRDLAELASATVPTVSRIMSGWERRGVIAGRRGRVAIRDLAALLALARVAGG